MTSMDRVAFLEVGNEFERIPKKEASYDRTGDFLKVYRLKIYVDVVEGNEGIISQVEADYGSTFPRTYKSIRRRQIRTQDGVCWRRFENTQEVYGMLDVKFTITGVGGTKLKIRYLTEKRENKETYPFVERLPELGLRQYSPEPLPRNVGFRLEFVTSTYQANSEWTSEGSAPATSFVRGDRGMHQLGKDLKRYARDQPFTFRIQVRVPEESTFAEIRNIYLNAIKYEDVIEALDLDDDIAEEDLYSSNKKIVPGTTNKAKHDAINSCQTLVDLKQCLNPSPSTRYKFNLFVEERIIEFCFRRFTRSAGRGETLVRFCVHFVNNSIRFRPPSSFKESRTVEEKTEFLFNLIKDPYVENNLMTDKSHNITGSVDTWSCSTHDMSTDSHVFGNPLPISSDTILLGSDLDDMSLMSCLAQSSHCESVIHPDYLPETHVNRYADQDPTNRKRQRGEADCITVDVNPQQVSPASLPPVNDTGNLPQAPQWSESLVGRKVSPDNDAPPTDQLELKVFHGSEDWGTDSNNDLKPFLKKLNSRVRNQKKMNLESLQSYIDARRNELSVFRQENAALLPARGVAVEVIHDGGTATAKICMYVAGGKKLERERSAVEKVKKLELSEIDASELSHVLSLLGRPRSSETIGQVAELDSCLDQWFGNDPPSDAVGFALIRVMEGNRKTRMTSSR
jgi:hypothetical protein